MRLRMDYEAVLAAAGFAAPSYDTGDARVLEITTNDAGEHVLRGREIGVGTVVAFDGDPASPVATAQLVVEIVSEAYVEPAAPAEPEISATPRARTE